MADAGPLLVVITGPSGVGKDSLLARLKALGRPYHFAVTATTRPPRPGEIEGIDYYFLSDQQFDEMLARGEFMEHAIVYDQRHGVPRTPVREALAAGRDVVMRTDVQGARYIKSVCPGALTVFVQPPSWEELEWRLRSRGTDDPQQLKLRPRAAGGGLGAARGVGPTAVNDDLHTSAEEIERIMAKERARKRRQPVVV